jgi:hypothetical protein
MSVQMQLIVSVIGFINLGKGKKSNEKGKIVF